MKNFFYLLVALLPVVGFSANRIDVQQVPHKKVTPAKKPMASISTVKVAEGDSVLLCIDNDEDKAIAAMMAHRDAYDVLNTLQWARRRSFSVDNCEKYCTSVILAYMKQHQIKPLSGSAGYNQMQTVVKKCIYSFAWDDTQLSMDVQSELDANLSFYMGRHAISMLKTLTYPGLPESLNQEAEAFKNFSDLDTKAFESINVGKSNYSSAPMEYANYRSAVDAMLQFEASGLYRSLTNKAYKVAGNEDMTKRATVQQVEQAYSALMKRLPRVNAKNGYSLNEKKTALTNSQNAWKAYLTANAQVKKDLPAAAQAKFAIIMSYVMGARYQMLLKAYHGFGITEG